MVSFADGIRRLANEAVRDLRRSLHSKGSRFRNSLHCRPTRTLINLSFFHSLRDIPLDL